MKPTALILLAHGTNRDHDVADALTQAGAVPEIVPLNDLRADRKHFGDYQMLVLPGGFSYADALGAGKLLAIDLQTYFTDQVCTFVASGKPVIGICNGFQALVKSGILPGDAPLSPRGGGAGGGGRTATLTFNAAGHFECRWVDIKPVSPACIWTKGLTDLITCPIAHGEGNFQTINHSPSSDLIALCYVHPDGSPANGAYPANPNGSLLDIAGICNPAGNVLGLMPHPENHVHSWQHPRWTRGERGRSGLPLFENGVRYVSQL
jgi:phosphoribosylformylglycinamidine synthase subunit PurQ / glutaminase